GSVRGGPRVVRSGPRRPPVPANAWQLRQFLLWNKAAPWRRNGVLFRTRPSGTGVPLQAVICGDQGEVAPWYVSTPRAVYITITASTATGRRLGARSPRLLSNGTRKKAATGIRGNRRVVKVSASVGLRDSKGTSHRNGQSGRGLAPGSVGSGGPVGPLGPRTAARTTTTITARAENRASFSMASPRKGTPLRSFSS